MSFLPVGLFEIFFSFCMDRHWLFDYWWFFFLEVLICVDIFIFKLAYNSVNYRQTNHRVYLSCPWAALKACPSVPKRAQARQSVPSYSACIGRKRYVAAATANLANQFHYTLTHTDQVTVGYSPLTI